MTTDTLTAILSQAGFYPVHPFSLYYPMAVLAIWILLLPLAYLKRIRIFYNASLRAAFIEELIYRGIVYGFVMYMWHSQIIALVVSSLLFGIAHMRNLWWAGWRRSWRTSVYTGFTAGPIFGLIRIVSGDIYLGILIHFLHNLFVMFPLPGSGHMVATVPTDAELKEKAEARR
jgi:membrane protease YdiL (CAAX protease family)